MGDGNLGEAPLREGVFFSRASADTSWEMKGLRWLGVALGQNLKNKEAQEKFTALSKLARKQGDLVQQAWAEMGLAFHHKRLGEVAEARDGYVRAVDLFHSAGATSGELFALNGLGIALGELQEYTAARTCYQRTVTASRIIGNGFAEALAENNLGTLDYSLGDPGLAQEHFRRAYDLQMDQEHFREAINAANNLAICLTRLGAFDQSNVILNEVVKTCHDRSYRDLEFKARTQQGLILSMQGRPSQAIMIFEELLTWPDEVVAKNRLELIQAFAEALDRQGKLPEAIDLMLAHVEAVKELPNAAVRLEYQALLGEKFVRNNQPQSALVWLRDSDAEAAPLHLNGIRLIALPQLGAAYLALGAPDSALACYQRAAAVWERERRVPLDPNWRERRGIAGRTIYTELAGLILDQASRAGNLEVGHKKAYAILQQFKARTLLERLHGPEGAVTTEIEPVKLSEVQAALRLDDSVLLDYFVGNNRSFLFTITANSLLVNQIPGSDALSQRIDLLRDLVLSNRETKPTGNASSSSPWDKVLLTGATALRNDLLPGEGAETALADKHVVFCPDDCLNRLPMILILSPNQAAKRSIIVRVPSASLWYDLRCRSNEKSTNDAPRLLASTSGDTSGNTRLAGARREVGWLQHKYSGVAAGLPDSMAGVAGLAEFDLIHLAAHAKISKDYSWRSTISVQTVTGSEVTLRAADIVRSSLKSRLTVLSACETAGGKMVDGEGVMGLSNALLAAGCPSVVATLWPVDDAATEFFMRKFYCALETGKSVASALAVARAHVADDHRFSDPRYWAGFVAIGDGAQVVSLPSRRLQFTWQLTLGIGLTLLAAAALTMKKL